MLNVKKNNNPYLASDSAHFCACFTENIFKYTQSSRKNTFLLELGAYDEDVQW